MGTGTYATTANRQSNGVISSITWSWTSTAGGAVVSDPVPGVNGFVVALETNPGSTAPTDDYDITVTDDHGLDVLLGVGANRDTANTEIAFPLTSSIPVLVPVNGSLTLNIANAGAAKDGIAIVHLLTGVT